MIVVAMVSTILPETNYTRYLIEAVQSRLTEDVRMLVYCDRREENMAVPLEEINLVWSSNPLYPFQIIKQVINDKPDIVHLQHEINMYGGPFTAILFPLLMFFLKMIRIKTIVTIHAVIAKDQMDGKLMRTFSWPQSKPFVRLAKCALSFIFRITSRLASGIIVHSQYLRSILISDYKARKDKVFVIPHGVPDKNVGSRTHSFRKEWGKHVEGKKIILYFGYVVRRKGLEHLIEAFTNVHENHPDYVLVMAGGELPYQKEYVVGLKHMVSEKGLKDKIVFTSFLNSGELERLFVLSEFVVLPCIYSISASGPLAIAMHYHKPVIATDIGTFHEDIDDGKDGLLYPIGDLEALEKAMNKLIEDSLLRQKLSEGMKVKAQNRCWSAIALKTYEIYQGLGASCPS